MATVNAVRAEVREALRALQTERDRYLRAGDAARLGEREYAAAAEGARLGLVTTFQLLLYEDQLAQARLLVSQARFALEDAGTQYRLAVGDGRRGYAPAGVRGEMK
jgi:outer membrane protein TolC